jgi:hypothetical protein
LETLQRSSVEGWLVTQSTCSEIMNEQNSADSTQEPFSLSCDRRLHVPQLVHDMMLFYFRFHCSYSCCCCPCTPGRWLVRLGKVSIHREQFCFLALWTTLTWWPIKGVSPPFETRTQLSIEQELEPFFGKAWWRKRVSFLEAQAQQCPCGQERGSYWAN